MIARLRGAGPLRALPDTDAQASPSQRCAAGLFLDADATGETIAVFHRRLSDASYPGLLDMTARALPRIPATPPPACVSAAQPAGSSRQAHTTASPAASGQKRISSPTLRMT